MCRIFLLRIPNIKIRAPPLIREQDGNMRSTRSQGQRKSRPNEAGEVHTRYRRALPGRRQSMSGEGREQPEPDAEQAAGKCLVLFLRLENK
jgi:hypothetical protein